MKERITVRLLLVKAIGFLASMLVVISVSEIPMWSESARFALYVPDMTCSCIRTTKQTKTVIASETQSGKSVYQVFKSVDAGQEMFHDVVLHFGCPG